MGRNGVGQPARIINARNRSQDFRRDLLVELDVLVKLLHHRAPQGFDLTGFRIMPTRLDRRDVGREVQFAFLDPVHPGALLAFHQHFDGAIRQLEHLQDGRDATHLEHVGDCWLVFGSGLLGHQHDPALGLHRGLQGLDALGTPDKQGDNHVREHHHVAQGQQWQINGFSRQGRGSGHGDPCMLS
jgi:hypothetical protein